MSRGTGHPAAALVARRVVRLIAVLLLVSAGTLLLLDLLPGDPAQTVLGETATPEQVDALSHRMGLDRPYVERLGDWIGGVARGDFGTSATSNEPVLTAIQGGLPVTIELAVSALVVSLLVAVPLAVYTANHPYGRLDRVVTFVASVLLATPGFLIAVLLVYFLAVSSGVFPVTGWVPLTESFGENVRHAALPVITLALPLAATFTRVLRNDVASTLDQDFVVAARARGLSRERVLFRHALRPSVLPLMTVAGVQLGYLIGGTVIVESVFVLPGIGRLTIQAINSRDYTSVQGIVFLAAVMYVLVNALVDLAYPVLDPRVRGRG
jgi:peptide/nickel transport system permease protein